MFSGLLIFVPLFAQQALAVGAAFGYASGEYDPYTSFFRANDEGKPDSYLLNPLHWV